MPHSPSPSTATDAPSVTSYGQVVEYIQDRLYLASYTHPPDDKTPFPYPQRPSRSQSPKKKSSRALLGAQEIEHPKAAPTPCYFSIDQTLLYNAFHADFGPLHIGHLYRFAVQLHDILGSLEPENTPVVLWSSPDSRSRANAACILATYMVLIQSWPPHLALAPIAQMDPPLMPFRDAGYSQADYGLTVQDVVYGVWKAKEEGLVGLKDFNLEEYETFERVDMGDFNWISPHFLAFASPQHKPVESIPSSHPLYATVPKNLPQIARDKLLPKPFKNVLSHFAERGIGLVVRLNSELYSPTYFSALGIQHKDMIFEDGTCPPLVLVRRFIDLAHVTINHKKKGIAVHCKAGLGRTGCLIGAYLIYRHGFTANEVIAFMRFMRPGMVVGPQQHWLHLNQGTFREWWYEDTLREKIIASTQPSTPNRLHQAENRRLASNGQTFTPPNGDRHAASPRRALGEITNNESVPPSGPLHASDADYKRSVGVADENLPAPTPGQPRKTSKIYGGRRVMTENQPFDVPPTTEIVQMQRSTYRPMETASESEEEHAIRPLSSSRKASQSPISRSGKRRAVSCTTTTTTTTQWDMRSATDTSEAENGAPLDDGDLKQAMIASPTKAPKTPNVKSGNGVGSLSAAKRSSPMRRSTEGKTSVRKTSGRIGSMNGSQRAGHRAS